MANLTLNQQINQNLKLICVSSIGALSLISALHLPTLSFLMCNLFGFTSIYYTQQRQLLDPKVSFRNKNSILSGLTMGLVIAWFYLPAAIQCGAIVSLSLGFSANFLMFIESSQFIFNQNLRNAVSTGRYKKVNNFLNLGADPFDYDLAGNHCYHHALLSENPSVEIIKRLNQPMSFSFTQMIFSFKLFMNENIKLAWQTLIDELKTVLDQNHPINRSIAFEAAGNLIKEYSNSTIEWFNVFALYLRHCFKSPKEINKPNLAGQTPRTLLDEYFLDNQKNILFRKTVIELIEELNNEVEPIVAAKALTKP